MLDVLTVADTVLKLAKADGRKMNVEKLANICLLINLKSVRDGNGQFFAGKVKHSRLDYSIVDLCKAMEPYGSKKIPLSKIGDVSDIKVNSDELDFIRKSYDKWGTLDVSALRYFVKREFSLIGE